MTKPRSKYWDKLCDVLDEEFPKGECKERGEALVLLAYAEMYLQEQKAELIKEVLEMIDDAAEKIQGGGNGRRIFIEAQEEIKKRCGTKLNK